MPPHQMMLGAYSFSGFHIRVRAYQCMSFCTNVCTYIHMYVHEPVKLRLRHLYHLEFCSVIVRYPTVGASVYCGHISSLLLYPHCQGGIASMKVKYSMIELLRC